MASATLIEAVAVTAELCGRTFSEPAARMFLADLQGLPEPAVMAALRRCRREVRGVLTVQDVVSRVDDGRPGPEEAWAMIPKDERASAVWTDEMREAFAVALPLLQCGEEIPARMAFKEAYNRLLSEARDAARPPNWTPTLGSDPASREEALRLAVERGRMSPEHAQTLALPAPASVALLLTSETPTDTPAKREALERLRALASDIGRPR